MISVSELRGFMVNSLAVNGNKSPWQRGKARGIQRKEH